jgi:hypothetical protein
MTPELPDRHSTIPPLLHRLLTEGFTDWSDPVWANLTTNDHDPAVAAAKFKTR